MTDKEKAFALWSLTRLDESGKHPTEIASPAVLEDFESQGLVVIDRSAERPGPAGWVVTVTEEAVHLIVANPSAYPSDGCE